MVERAEVVETREYHTMVVSPSTVQVKWGMVHVYPKVYS